MISFYRGGWCPYCNLELRALSQRLSEFKKLGAHIVAISPELPERAAIAGSDSLGFPVLFDQDNRVAREFRIVHLIDPDVVAYQAKNGNDVAKYNGQGTAEVPLPATYIVDSRGIICFDFVDADYTRRAEPDVLLEALRACTSFSL